LTVFTKPESLDRVAKQLITKGDVSLQGDKLQLTESGKAAARTVLGSELSKPWDYIRDRRLPIIALGLDPDSPEVRRKIAKSNVLKAAIVAVAFDLPKDIALTPDSVRSELVWRVLRSAIPELVGRGPFPAIGKSNAVDCSILAGLAGTPVKRLDIVIAALAARAIGAHKADLEVLRMRLVQLALDGVAPATAVVGDQGNVRGFGERVRAVARTLSTPPFRGRVAIAQVYDAYGRQHPDAGSLASFKERLVKAAKARQLDLTRLDLPEHMERDLRERSHTVWDSNAVHFIVT
jgi:hypothetical protein